jgi:hypothetical protein
MTKLLTTKNLIALSYGDLYRARAKLSSAITQMIDFIEFDEHGDVRVILLAGIKAYQFQGSDFRQISCFNLIGLTDSYAMRFSIHDKPGA